MTWTNKPGVTCIVFGALFGCSSDGGVGAGSGGGSGAGGAATGGAALPVGGGGTAAMSTGGASGASGFSGGAATTTGGAQSAGGAATGGRAAASGGVTTGGAGGQSGGAVGSGGAATAGNAATGGKSSTGGAATAGADGVDAVSMAKDMGFGTNIGNTLENTTIWETGWGQPLITQAYIQGMASRGIKTVRVPVAWNTYASNGAVDPTKMARVKEVVGLIEAAGMYSIVNIHWDGGWIHNDTEGNANRYRLTDDVKAKFSSYWTQIAKAFETVGHKLVFEGLNEESKFYVNGDTNGAADYAALNALNQLFVTTVRAQAGFNATRALLIAGFTTDIELTCVDAFAIPTDPAGPGKLFLSLHYYTPWTFCGLDTVETWGSPQTTWGTSEEKAALESLFTKLATFSANKKIPVILGEFAVLLGENYPREPASRGAWMQAVTQAALSRGMVPLLWDTGSEISRTDGSFSAELQTVMAAIQ